MTRLKSAIPMDEYEDRVSGFGAREDREARRAERRKRRRGRKEDRRERRDERKGGRKERKAERRIDRVQRKKEKVREKLATVPGSSSARAEPTLVPAPSAMPGEAPKPKKKWVEKVTDLVDEFLEDDDLEPEELEEEDVPDDVREATEGVGAWQLPLRVTTQPEAWGPAVRMGNRLKIQAAQGFRAAVIELKPGLFLVAEMPEAVTRTEFGLAPLLAPLMTTAARRSLDEPPRRRGLFRNLFRRRDAPIRYVTVQPPAVVPVAPAPAALPGPVEPEAQPMVVAAPNVGWADDATVAAAYGCDCEKEPR